MYERQIYRTDQSMRHHQISGFTLVELIIVFSIITLLSLIGIASLVTFAREQTLAQTYGDVRTALVVARSQTVSQVNKPTQCQSGASCACPAGSQFNGYEVLFCCVSSGQGCPVCYSQGSSERIEVNIRCGANAFTVSTTAFPQGVSVDSQNTTSRSFLFTPITGVVQGHGTVTIENTNDNSRSIVVTSQGLIQ